MNGQQLRQFCLLLCSWQHTTFELVVIKLFGKIVCRQRWRLIELPSRLELRDKREYRKINHNGNQCSAFVNRPSYRTAKASGNWNSDFVNRFSGYRHCKD